LLALISHTPVWVFAILFVLLVVGSIQTKARKVSANTIFILPIAMVFFSVFNVYSAFGFTFFIISAWFFGLILSIFIGIKLGEPKDVNFSIEDNTVVIPGSWIPLFIMMVIFFTKYFVNVAAALEFSIIFEANFILFISAIYGVCSGVFISRGLITFNSKKYRVDNYN